MRATGDQGLYHHIVRPRVRRLFEAVNAGNFEPVVPQFAHVLVVDNALGGTRCTVEATRAWYARLRRLLPGLKFEV
jgi:hypothetical protein